MKRWITVLLIGSLGALTAGSAEARPPTVGTRLADYGARLALKKFPIWNQRDNGSIKCPGGQFSRTAWFCRARVRTAGVCRRGRALTFSTNDKFAKGPYRTKVNFSPGRLCQRWSDAVEGASNTVSITNNVAGNSDRAVATGPLVPFNVSDLHFSVSNFIPTPPGPSSSGAIVAASRPSARSRSE